MEILLSSRENLALVSLQAFNETNVRVLGGGELWGKARRESDYVLSEEQFPPGRIRAL